MKDLQNFLNILFGNLVVLLLVAASVILYSMFDNLSVTVRDMSKGMIRDRLDLTKKELNNIFDPIDAHLRSTKSRGQKGLFKDVHDDKNLNAFFLPILKHSSSLSSLILANDLGDEYMLLKTDSLWLTRLTYRGSEHKRPIAYHWFENSEEKDSIVRSKELDVSYDPRIRPWYKLAMNNPSDTAINWSSPYTFFTSGQPGITASVKWQDPETGNTYVFAIDVLIEDLSEFTTTIDVTSNGKVIILSDQFLVMGLPKDERFLKKETRKHYSLKKPAELDIPLLNETIKNYGLNGDSVQYVSFKFEDEIWWSGFDIFELNSDKKLYIGVVVPETDFSNDIESTRQLLIGGFFLIFLFFIIILYAFIQMKRANKIIAIEKDKNEKLLLNTLPIKVVNDLKENGKSDPQKFRNVSVCFADIVGFTQASAKLDPKILIEELNDIYTAFDEIMIKYDCERIKTIGDAYLAVCGMPQKNEQHAEMMLRASLEILEFIKKRNRTAQLEWQMRIGIHSGNVVGGIVGIKKYIYDVFGDTINTASRMESNSEPMRVNLSEETFMILKDSDFVRENGVVFEKRDPIPVKGKGTMKMYFVSF